MPTAQNAIEQTKRLLSREAYARLGRSVAAGPVGGLRTEVPAFFGRSVIMSRKQRSDFARRRKQAIALHQRSVPRPQIAKELKVTLGTVNRYLRGHGRTPKQTEVPVSAVASVEAERGFSLSELSRIHQTLVISLQDAAARFDEYVQKEADGSRDDSFYDSWVATRDEFRRLAVRLADVDHPHDFDALGLLLSELNATLERYESIQSRSRYRSRERNVSEMTASYLRGSVPRICRNAVGALRWSEDHEEALAELDHLSETTASAVSDLSDCIEIDQTRTVRKNHAMHIDRTENTTTFVTYALAKVDATFEENGFVLRPSWAEEDTCVLIGEDAIKDCVTRAAAKQGIDTEAEYFEVIAEPVEFGLVQIACRVPISVHRCHTAPPPQ